LLEDLHRSRVDDVESLAIIALEKDEFISLRPAGDGVLRQFSDLPLVETCEQLSRSQSRRDLFAGG